MRQYVIASIMIIVGLLSMFFKGKIPETNLWNQFLGDLSSAVLVSGLLSLLFKIFQDKENESTLKRLMRIHDSVDELGLEEIKTDVQSFSFTSLIENSNELSIIMNDGQRWVGNNSVSLTNRFNKNTITLFFTVDPDSDFLVALSKKTDTDKEQLKEKIRDTWTRLEQAYNNSDKKGTLKIYRLKNYPTKSVFCSEKELIETPYQTSSGRVRIPLYIYKKVSRKDSPYSFVKNDIEELIKESILEKEFKTT